jgi:hypothetical protein
MRVQFRKDFRVRRTAIEQWLQYLLEHHPGYRGFVTLSQDNLQQLPAGQQPPEQTDRLALSPAELETDFATLSAIVNRVQRHHCNTSYCLRKKKGARVSGLPACRFYFPRTLRDTPALKKALNPNFFMFAPERNDDRLNNYNRLLTLCWLANLDIAPIISEQTVCDYVGKYVTKAEIPTLGYQDIVKKLLPNINANRPMLSLVARS